MPEHHAITIDENDQHLLISWDNRKCEIERSTFWFMIGFMCAWGAFTLLMTFYMLKLESFDWSWSAFVAILWLSCTLVPFRMFQLRHEEWLKIDINNQSVSWGRNGFLAPAPQSLQFPEVSEITLGQMPTPRHTRESMTTLCVWQVFGKGKLKRRHLMAYWLRKDLKAYIHEHIRQFADRHNLPFTVHEYR